MIKILGIFFTVFYLTSAYAQTNFSNKEINISISDNPPTIDGIFTPSEWQDATLIENLVELQPVFSRTPQFSTKIYVKYDSQNMYVAAKLMQPRSSLVANQLVQGKNGLGRMIILAL